MQKHLSVPEVEGVPALCAPSDAERDRLARLKAAQTAKPSNSAKPDSSYAEDGISAGRSSPSVPRPSR